MLGYFEGRELGDVKKEDVLSGKNSQSGAHRVKELKSECIKSFAVYCWHTKIERGREREMLLG